MTMYPVQNPFTTDSEAQRYNQYRPQYHDLAVAELAVYLKSKNIKIDSVLDMACGTGHSTKALFKQFKNLTACDASAAMLKQAQSSCDAKFILSAAEKTEFHDQQFDLINCSMAYQWFDQKLFLSEMIRILQPAGILCIDNYGFAGVMVGNENFKELYKKFDAENLPSAPRHPDYPTDDQMTEFKLVSIQTLKYEHEVQMNCLQFINYLMTRSNFQILNTDQKNVASDALEKYYSVIFGNESQRLLFRGQSRLYSL